MTEIPYFNIGESLGGSQDWMMDPWMRLGGCAALAAVDSCIHLTLFHKKKKLCPFDVHNINRDLYKRFAMHMKPYIRPRFRGVNRLDLYTDGVEWYLKDIGYKGLGMERYAMGCPASQAAERLMEQLDQGMIVPVLLLNPISKEWKEYTWHWFILGGYRLEEGKLFVKAITYGEAEWLSWEGFWDEKNPENGGMILYYDD